MSHCSEEPCDVDQVPVSDVDTDLLSSYSALLAENIELRSQLDKAKAESAKQLRSPSAITSGIRRDGPVSSAINKPQISDDKYTQCGQALLTLQQLNKRVAKLRQHQSESFAHLEDAIREQESSIKIEPTDLFPVPLQRTVPAVVTEELQKRAELQAEIVVLKKTISRLELVADTEKTMRISYLEALARAEAAENELLSAGRSRGKRSDSLPPAVVPISNSSPNLCPGSPTGSRSMQPSPSPSQKKSSPVLLTGSPRHASVASSFTPSSSLRMSQKPVVEPDVPPHSNVPPAVSLTTDHTRRASLTTPSVKPSVPVSHSYSGSTSSPLAKPSVTSAASAAQSAVTSPVKTDGPSKGPMTASSVKNIDGQIPIKEQQQLIHQWLSEAFSISVPEPTDDPSTFWKAFNDAVIFLEIIDRIRPGMVNWFAIARPKPGGRPIQMFQRMSNCSLAAQSLEIVLPSLHHVDGKDISEEKQNVLVSIFQEMVRTFKPK